MPRRRSRRTHTASDLKQLAWSQKVLILCLLGHLVLWFGYIGLAVTRTVVVGDFSVLFNLVLLLSVFLGILSGVFIFLVETKLSSAVVALFVGVLTAVPCMGLIIILTVNTRATSALQANGVRVGLLGASLPDIAALLEEIDEEEFEDDDEDDRPRSRSEYEVDEREGW